MKRTTSKWISLLLMATMLVGLLPPISALAAIQMQINNLYTVPGNQPDAITAANDANVIRLTVSPITVSVTISGIPDDKITDIYYEITNMNTGIPSENRTNKAAKNPNNNNEVIFNNVVLTEGLNRIVIKYGDTSIVSSRSGWAYFTPVTNITGLKFSGDDFVDGGIYPKSPPYTSLSITGKANNATQLQVYVTGMVYSPTVFNRGDFTFITNTGRPSDMNFRPGDNEIRFLGQNNTNSYHLDRSFVYDNGRAFAYNADIDVTGAAVPARQKLVKVPTLVKDTATQANVQSLIKVPVSSTTNIPTYDYVNIYMLGTGYTVRYDLKTNARTIGGAPSGTVTESTTDSVVNRYKVFNMNEDLPTNPASKYQEVVYEFGTTTTGIVDTTRYGFYTIDNNIPYVDHVDYLITNNSAVKLNEVGSTQINRFPSKLQIYTTDDADQVKVLINGAPYGSGGTGLYPANAPVAPAPADAYGIGPDGSPMRMAQVDLSTIPDGSTTLKIVPMNAGVEYAQGVRTYSLDVSGAPYVIINNLYNGQVFTKSSNIACNTGENPCFQGRIVNLPESEYDNIVFQINDKTYNIPAGAITKSADPANPDPNAGVFKILGTAMSTSTPATSIVNELASDGRKAIKFTLRVNGKIVTESTYDIYILSDKVPFINKLIPVETNPDLQQFIKKENDTFVTTATEVSLTGDVRNSTRTGGRTDYKIEYALPGTTAKIPVTYISNNKILDDAADPINSNFTETFTTAVIPLPNTGDYYFTMTATNDSGITATKTVKITKEALPYQILEPKLIRNASGKDQANINKNYQVIKIFAEKADSIMFGKDAAIKNGDTFTYEAAGLRPGANEIKFTVNRGTTKLNGSITLFNVNTPIEGAQYKSELQSTMKVFDGDIELKFPKDTKLMRNDRTASNQYLTTARKLLFGIADLDYGRVDKDLDGDGSRYLNGAASTYRFKPVSKLYWIDAGTITPISNTDPNYSVKLKAALEGSGNLPMAPKDASGEPKSFYERNYNDLVVPTKGATLTLKFDQSVRDDAWKYISVFQYGQFPDSTGGVLAEQGWRNIGGVIDSKKNTITVPIDSFGYFQVMYMNNSFEDVTNHPWARDYLDTLYSKGLMLNSDPQGGRFLPNDAITRGEFVSLLVKAFDIPLQNEDTLTRTIDPNDPKYQGTFGDVRRGYNIPNSNGLYDFLHIEAAARAGIVRGTSQGVFLPNTTITRQDAAVMIARAADLKMTTDTNKSLQSLQKTFTDANSIDIYARGAVEAVTKAGFIQGKPNELLPGQTKQSIRFDPTDTFTRAEAAAVAMRILQQLKKVPK